MSSLIPRIIHQTWKSAVLPEPVSRCVSTVTALNPSWSHRFYTDGDLDEVIGRVANESPAGEFLTVEEFERIPSGVEKSDVFRCAALYLMGGIYCDVDIEFLQPADRLIERANSEGLFTENTELLLTTDHPIHCERLHGNEPIMNHFMIARPGAHFLGIYLRTMAHWLREGQMKPGQDPVKTTGPKVFTDLISGAGGTRLLNIGLMPSPWINPLPDMAWDFPEMSYFDSVIRNKTWRSELQSYTAHYWWHSYCGAECIFDIYGDLIFG